MDKLIKRKHLQGFFFFSFLNGWTLSEPKSESETMSLCPRASLGTSRVSLDPLCDQFWAVLNHHFTWGDFAFA